MAEFPACPVFTDALLADTQHLTAEEFGVYLRLLFTAWRRPNCDLPDDDRFLAVMSGVGLRRWKALRPKIIAFFIVTNGLMRQKRLTKERLYVDGHAKRMSDNANIRWNKTKGLADATAMPRHMQRQYHSNAPTPTPLLSPPTGRESSGLASARSPHGRALAALIGEDKFEGYFRLADFDAGPPFTILLPTAFQASLVRGRYAREIAQAFGDDAQIKSGGGV